MNASRRWLLLPAALATCVLQSGCMVGPAAIRVSQSKYNDAIQYTMSEQLLLNLVRLRYRDVPFFLQVSSISTQFEIDQSVDLTATITENVGTGTDGVNPDVLAVGGRMGYSERPTVTITPLQGDEFVRRMLTTFTPETIALLQTAGWSIDRILILTVTAMNNLRNAPNASSPTPDDPPRSERFARAASLLRQLQRQHQISFVHDVRDEGLSHPLTAAAVNADHLLAAAREGYSFRRTDDETYVLTGRRRVLQLVVAESARDSAEWRELADLLALDPQRLRFDLVVGAPEEADQRPPEPRSEIRITTRAFLGTLFLVSHAVEVPDAHRAAGLVTVTRTPEGDEVDWNRVINDLLRVRSQRLKPRDAAVSVQYRGNWFYIDDADRNSKATFILLTQLFALQAGTADGAGPVLTLPVGS